MNIGIIGLGLIGGSFGKTLLKKTSHKVFGYDIVPETITLAKSLKVISEPLSIENCAEIDIAIFALNPCIFESEIFKYAPHFKAGTIVIDICGNKTAAVEVMQKAALDFPKLNFISTHPMAGREFSGLIHSSSALFERASILMIPVKSDNSAQKKLSNFLSELGFGFIKTTTASEHDQIIAFTSQLPHIISSCYVDSPFLEKNFGFSAGSFMDMSRVAFMNAEMWTELFLGNSQNLLQSLDIFIQNISKIRDYIASGDEASLKAALESSSNKKEKADKDLAANKKQLKDK